MTHYWWCDCKHCQYERNQAGCFALLGLIVLCVAALGSIVMAVFEYITALVKATTVARKDDAPRVERRKSVRKRQSVY
jgi:hypothetical protein